MLTLEVMLVRLLIAVVLGAIIGIERELAGKAAGLRTDVMVAAGAAIFAMIGIALPYLVATSPDLVPEIIARNGGFISVIANIVVGIGFLGAGIMIHQGTQVLGVTTAATVWLTAAVGTLCGIGLTMFAIVATLCLVLLLAVLRHVDVHKIFKKK